MANSSVEEKVKLLTEELSALMQLKPKGGQEEMNRWSDIVQSQELEVNKLLIEFNKLRKGHDKNNMQAMVELNKKVIQVTEYVKSLIISNVDESSSIESFPKKLATERYSRQDIESFTHRPVESILKDLGPKRYSCKDIESLTSKFRREIGSGGYGKVYKGQLPNGVQVAVKVLKEDDFVEETFIAEVSTMGRAYHRNLIKLYGYCFDQSLKALVYEYMDKGSFDQILFDNPHRLEWEKFYDIAIAIAKGLSYLHEDCDEIIIHHDVKPANVLIDSNFSVKITDFGLAKLMKNDVTHRINTDKKGTAYYMAPELLYPFDPVSSKCDVYSFGVVLFEILRKKRNMQHGGWFPKQVWEKFEAGKLDEVLTVCGISEKNRGKAKILSKVALWCVQHTPKGRPPMRDVVNMLQGRMPVQDPPNPFKYSSESSLPAIQEEIDPEEPPSIFGERRSEPGLSIKSKRISNAEKSDSMLESFQKRSRYPHGGENAAVVYTTSITAIRKVFDRCREVIAILKKHKIKLMERDVYDEEGHKEELENILGVIQLPAVFVDLRFIGGADEVIKMEKEDRLTVLFDEVNRNKGKRTLESKIL